MHRQWNIPPHNYTSYTDGFRNPLVFSQTNLPKYMQPKSKSKDLDKSVNKSRGKRVISYQDLAQSTCFKSGNVQSLGDANSSRCDLKSQGGKEEMDKVLKRVRELEGKMVESDHRVSTLQRSNKNTAQLTASLQQFMRNQYAQIKDRQALEERVLTFQQALGHLSSIKADRKQLQNLQLGRYYGLTERYNELQRQGEQVNNQITEINNKFGRMMAKVETMFMAIGEKYEEFIESNLIKTIEHVNQETEKCYRQIEEIGRDHSGIGRRLEGLEMEKEMRQGVGRSKLMTSELLGIALPNIRIVQTLSMQRDDRRPTRNSLLNLKEHIKQQVKEAIPLAQSISTSSSNVTSDVLLNNMYESTDMPHIPHSDIQFQKVVYKLDRYFNLLDENEHYIMTASGEHVKLSQNQLVMLKENGLFL